MRSASHDDDLRASLRACAALSPRDRNVWCVKYEWISGASEATCGISGPWTAFWGDTWDVDKSVCKYQECSYTCPAMPMGIREKRRVWKHTIDVQMGVLETDYEQREINCCKDRDFCNGTPPRERPACHLPGSLTRTGPPPPPSYRCRSRRSSGRRRAAVCAAPRRDRVGPHGRTVLPCRLVFF